MKNNNQGLVPAQGKQRYYFSSQALYLLFIFTLYTVISLSTAASANEALRIAGMGGAFIGISSSDAGIFGNPAVLTDVENNNLTFAFSIENFSYDELSEDPNEKFAAALSLRSEPSLYYSRSYKGIGFSLGILAGLHSKEAKFVIETTRSDYIVNERKFEAYTDVLLNYDALWESGIILGLGKRLQNAKLGMRLKVLRQTAKRGQIASALHLTSVHGEEVNRNQPKEFIPAIIDNLKYEILRDDNAELDLSATGLDIDIGMHTDVLAEGITAGVLFSNLLQLKLADSRHAMLGVGVGYNPVDWITSGLDVRKKFGEKGLAANLGWEIRGQFRKGASVDVAFRNGISMENSQTRFSLGVKLALGNSYWEYSLTKRFSGQSLRNANHVVASTICF